MCVATRSPLTYTFTSDDVKMTLALLPMRVYGDEAVVVAHIVHGLAEYRLIPVRPYYRRIKNI